MSSHQKAKEEEFCEMSKGIWCICEKHFCYCQTYWFTRFNATINNNGGTVMKYSAPRKGYLELGQLRERVFI